MNRIAIIIAIIIVVILVVGFLLYSASQSTTATTPTTPAASSPSYLGCYKDTDVRALPNKIGVYNTVTECVAAAKAGGYKYAGLQYGGECYAGNSGYDKYGAGTTCAYKCGGYKGIGAATTTPTEYCGSAYNSAVWQTG